MSQTMEGTVQLGDLVAPANWTNGQILAIRFSRGSLQTEQWKIAEHLQRCSNPVRLAFDGARNDRSVGRIVGYEQDARSVTFYVIKTQEGAMDDGEGGKLTP